MPEADIVFTTVASIHLFCSKTALIFFWGIPHCSLLHACLWWHCHQGSLPSLGLDNHPLGSGTQAEQRKKLPVTHPSKSLSTGIMEIIHLVFHPLTDGYSFFVMPSIKGRSLCPFPSVWAGSVMALINRIGGSDCQFLCQGLHRHHFHFLSLGSFSWSPEAPIYVPLPWGHHAVRKPKPAKQSGPVVKQMPNRCPAMVAIPAQVPNPQVKKSFTRLQPQKPFDYTAWSTPIRNPRWTHWLLQPTTRDTNKLF